MVTQLDGRVVPNGSNTDADSAQRVTPPTSSKLSSAQSGPRAATATSQPSKAMIRRVLGGAVSFFSMKAELANADQRTWRREEPGYDEFRLARSILETAHDVDDLPKHALSAVTLLLQAGRFAARSLVLHRGLMQTVEDDASVWQKACEARELQPIVSSLSAGLRARTDGLIRSGVSVENTNLSASELAGLRSTLTPVVDKMVEVLERDATLSFRIKSERLFRWMAVAAALLGLGVWHYRLEIRSMMLPNLALHKDVKVSSNWRVGMYPSSKLVDGEVTELGCHTDAEDQPWAQVDLGRKVSIHRVVVTNRLGGETARAVPLELELSVDGINFTHYARQDDDFNVWIASTGRVTKARYVRVTVQKRAMLHLNEIEVY